MVCPFLKICKKRIDFDYFEAICLSEKCCIHNFMTPPAYMECQEYKKLKQEEKTPKEWHEETGDFICVL